ncbi:hypothetical protein CPB84DRAFT_1764362 [Gymnopilus junonius]|uniref:F-box domain-containing protein n=1 Tax=Gymnopilus junonius TaxID=109634 RepID=A0A9P5TT01_GYMJU|nr:hypothetical protein CPB84DRAFT_1764362 [Gymnopilus junonius]
MQDHDRLLPPEIWLEIFDWATYNPNFGTDESTPFQQIPRGRGLDTNLQVRATLCLVCRTWQAWIAQSLYRDVHINRNTNDLHRTLSVGNFAGRRYGDMVHRMVLPYHSTVPGPHPSLKSIEILELCSSLHTLHRPLDESAGNLRFDYEAVGVSLPSLQRLEWWHHNEAERSGGINSLVAVLRGAPNLRYLFVGGVMGAGFVILAGKQSELILLPNLHIFRLNIRNGMLLHQILSRWILPSLTHLILDSPPVRGSLDDIWEKFGQQLEVVEFGKHTMQVHPSVSVVGLHAEVNGLLSNGDSVWGLIESHFEVLSGPKFPGLRRIILYGNWKPILGHRRFAPMRNKVWQNGRVLEFPDETRI